MKATYRLQFNGKHWQLTAINELYKFNKIILLCILLLIVAIHKSMGRGLIIRWCSVRLRGGPPKNQGVTIIRNPFFIKGSTKVQRPKRAIGSIALPLQDDPEISAHIA